MAQTMYQDGPRQRFPEAAFGLRGMLATLPGVVRSVLQKYRLQRSGCLLCGIGPHCSKDCPRLVRESADAMETSFMRQWMSIIWEELLLCSSHQSLEA